jgi:hypothetical protein
LNLKFGKQKMNDYPWKELLVERDVHFAMEVDGELIIVEKVPARVNPETGEQLLSINTLQRLKQMLKERKNPSRVIKTPVYEYSA